MSTTPNRAGAHVPPIIIKTNRIKQYLCHKHGINRFLATSHSQYQNGLAAVRAYWKQAPNMTLDEQREYKYARLVDNGSWFVQNYATTKPSNHNLTRLSKIRASLLKYVMLSALYPPDKLITLKNHISPVLGEGRHACLLVLKYLPM